MTIIIKTVQEKIVWGRKMAEEGEGEGKGEGEGDVGIFDRSCRFMLC